MADGFVQGDNLICGLHGWDYRYATRVSEYNNKGTSKYLKDQKNQPIRTSTVASTSLTA